MKKLISDMYLAAAILSYGGNLVGIDRGDTTRQKFNFSEGIDYIWVLDQNNVAKLINPSLEDVEVKFFSQCLVFPPCYPDALRRIKSAIHSR
jgi:hypothetical protein